MTSDRRAWHGLLIFLAGFIVSQLFVDPSDAIAFWLQANGYLMDPLALAFAYYIAPALMYTAIFAVAYLCYTEGLAQPSTIIRGLQVLTVIGVILIFYVSWPSFNSFQVQLGFTLLMGALCVFTLEAIHRKYFD